MQNVGGYLTLNVLEGSTYEVLHAQYQINYGPSCSFSAPVYLTSLSVQQPIQLPSTYSSAPTSNCVGYLNTTQATAVVSMANANQCYSIHSMTISAGTWLVYGTASLITLQNSYITGGANALIQVQGGICFGTINSFDNTAYTTILPLMVSNPQNIIMTLPQRYYSGNGTTVYITVSISWANMCTSTISTPSVLSAVRIA